ncbi:methyltransferase family protein [Fontibacillus phaseoli]|uniref:Methyltransferase family protein n=1 Tax=Fontibacillus phaseoli TaxID=1416533 RepID=A0A369B1X9_9BACL|nr:class I SAM-dependent methyltransferase [Fontibacillus phaseoli]RCX15421.1 methyltransferase family protein [Fontibacillus phaseoli]
MTEHKLAQQYREYWDKGAAVYDEIVDAEFATDKYEQWNAILSNLLSGKKNLNILDVGTGPGFFGVLLSRMGHQVTAIDSSPEMVARAHKNAQKYNCDIKIIKTDIIEYKPEDTFDIIISRNVTWFLYNPVAAYQNWYEMLNDGGQAIIFDANWNLFLSDPQEAELFRKAKEEAIEQGYLPYREEKDIEEGDQLALTLPLTYVRRPGWDSEMLRSIGFNKTHVHQGFDTELYTPGEQVLNRHRPMFAIVAEK